MFGNFFIVATPIGNLDDITVRAVETLKGVDLILAEDTRVTRKLLDHYKIESPLESFHEHSDEIKYQKIFNLLRQNKNLALVSDAGTPAINDPGAFLVQRVTIELPEVRIIPIPGASALTAFLSIAGLKSDQFLFLGFPPHKKGRRTFFEKIRNAEYPVIFFESTHRIVKALEALKESDKEIVIGRELTKKFETIYRGSAQEILEKLPPDQTRGEFVVGVYK